MMPSPVERLLRKLPDAKKTGKGWSARCPAHEDRSPSLSVAEGKDGRALVKCHAGCTADAICAALDLRVKDLMPQSGTSASSSKTGDNGKQRKKKTKWEPKPQRLTPIDEQPDWDAWIENNPGCTQEGMLRSGVTFGTESYYEASVFAWPILVGTDLSQPGSFVFMSHKFKKLVIDDRAERKMCSANWPEGQRSGLLVPPACIEAIKAGKATEAIKVEGVTDYVALLAAMPASVWESGRVVVFTHSAGAAACPDWAMEWVDLWAEDVTIIADSDEAGLAGAEKWAIGIRHLREDQQVKTWHPSEGEDLRDWLLNPKRSRDDESSAWESFQQTILEYGQHVELDPDRPVGKRKEDPRFFAPGKSHTDTQAAAKAAEVFKASGDIFRQGNSVVCVENGVIDELVPAALGGIVESAGFQIFREDAKGKQNRDCLVEATARRILASPRCREGLPEIEVVSPCPVITEVDGELHIVHEGQIQNGVFVDGGDVVEGVPFRKARNAILDLFSDTRFASAGDLSRVVAGLLTPAIVFGSLLNGRAPLELTEADRSQSGKGYRNKITTAIYNARPLAISMKKAGTGSLDDSLSVALMEGRSFVSLDNLRGMLDSQLLEQCLTEDWVIARAAFRRETPVTMNRRVLLATSNRAEFTRDLANRASIVRILKQPAGYRYRRFQEGDLLSHVRANQAYYLGCVFSVILEWWERGRQRSNETRHDFREWCQTLDWVSQELFGLAPLMNGHQEAQARTSSRSLNWLREVGQAVISQGQEGACLRVYQVARILEEDGTVEIPGLRGRELDDEDAWEATNRSIGRRLSRAFKDMGSPNSCTLGDVFVERQEELDIHRNYVWEYRFSSVGLETSHRTRIGRASDAPPEEGWGPQEDVPPRFGSASDSASDGGCASDAPKNPKKQGSFDSPASDASDASDGSGTRVANLSEDDETARSAQIYALHDPSDASDATDAKPRGFNGRRPGNGTIAQSSHVPQPHSSARAGETSEHAAPASANDRAERENSCPHDWSDKDVGDWIRTTCRRCGKFRGYRPR